MMGATELGRRVAMVLAGLALMAGMWGGLSRVGLQIRGASLGTVHGPLMVAGFLGTLIALERAVAYGRPWGYLAPLSSGLGGLLLIVLGDDQAAAQLLLVLGALGLSALMTSFSWRQRSLNTGVMTLGAYGLLLGNTFWWLGAAVAQVVPLWVAFLLLTVAGERFELSRMIPAGPLRRDSLILWSALLWIGSLLPLWWAEGWRLTGLGLIAGSYWLLTYDIAWRTRRAQELPRYMALAVLAASSWMMVAGGMALVWGRPAAGFAYDAFLHAAFLGFGFGMVMAHAPLMAPTLVGGRARFSPLLYLPTALLHLSMVGRVASDLMRWQEARMVSSTVNVIAILSFVAVTAFNVIGSHRE